MDDRRVGAVCWKGLSTALLADAQTNLRVLLCRLHEFPRRHEQPRAREPRQDSRAVEGAVSGCIGFLDTQPNES